MNKHTNLLLVAIVSLLVYISILKTIEVFREDESQYLYIGDDPLDQLDQFPRLKVDAKSGILYRLTKINNQYKWVKVK